jgi:hypothetical protein
MSGAEPKPDRRERWRQRKRDGLVRLVIVVDKGCWAETLWSGGFIGSADEEDRQVLEAGTQRLAEALIDITRDEGRVPVAGFSKAYGDFRKDKSP